MKSTDLRPGLAIKMDSRLYLITKVEHRTPGNLRAFVQVLLRDLNSGALIDKRLRSGEEVEQVDLDRRPMEYLYKDGDKFVFMDSQSYEQAEMSSDFVGDMPLYVLPNNSIIVNWCDGKPISIEMPNMVELVVKDTPPGIKGATATNQLKEATLETGLKTRVPPFISIGEKVRVSTEDGSYQSRA
ncbi:MAG: elongation factor P [Planctomycetes bacterium]|nr:elongation factor P [Planctomycetota bacterium]